MLGQSDTLDSPVFHKGWGLYPRMAHGVLEAVKRRTDATFVVSEPVHF